MTKRKSEPVEVEESVVEEVVQAEAPEAEEAVRAKSPEKKELGHRLNDVVTVRFTGEFGLLAGRAVAHGEVHQVRYWQYLQAQETGGDAYVLVES